MKDLIKLADQLPKIRIDVEGRPYLVRYYLGGLHPSTAFGIKGEPLPVPIEGVEEPTMYLHHFLNADPDRELHNHPWVARCAILTGGYVEKYLAADNSVQTRTWGPGEVNEFGPNHYHRIAALHGDTWTLVVHGRRTQPWGFLHLETGEIKCEP